MKPHWQHRAATPEGVDAAIRLRESGLEPLHVRLLGWVRTQRLPVTAGAVARGYFKADFDMKSNEWHHRFQEAKTLLESLAFNGYLLRGRFHTNSTYPKSGGKFSGTHYRCSVKARKLLIEQ